ncbi:hypothetical protein SRABI128_03648 [Microbacterium sp. Bi128]|nr:hypothetical protein SRABI128_03648 [Microbacterium sp. Bi128]
MLSTLGVKSVVAMSCGMFRASGYMVPMAPSRMATHEALCIPARWPAPWSTAASREAAGMGMVTTRVTGRSKLRTVPRWSVTWIPAGPEAEPGGAVPAAPAGGVDCGDDCGAVPAAAQEARNSAPPP